MIRTWFDEIIHLDKTSKRRKFQYYAWLKSFRSTDLSAAKYWPVVEIDYVHNIGSELRVS